MVAGGRVPAVDSARDIADVPAVELVSTAALHLMSAAAVQLGLAADRWPRLRLLASGLALWSAMTALSGLAKSFLHLAIPRIFVGIGEGSAFVVGVVVLTLPRLDRHHLRG